MKTMLLQLAAYNHWANKRLADAMEQLPESLLTKEFPSSFPSVFKTWEHMLFAESIWYQRVQKSEGKDFTPEAINGDTKAVMAALLKQNKTWQQCVETSGEAELNNVIHYTKGEIAYQQKLYEIILHVFNHGTYHRGQLVNMLRQAGVEKIPGTDLILWMREKQAA